MRRRYFLLAAFIAALDLASKALIIRAIPLESGRSITVIPHFFYLVHTQNPGVVFGILSDGTSPWQAAGLVAMAVFLASVISLLITRQPRDRFTLAGFALGLVLGGAIGNLLDRAYHGGVTDFLDFFLGRYHWHTFNVADSAVVCGAVLLAWDILFGQSPRLSH